MNKKLQRQQLDEIFLKMGNFRAFATPTKGWLCAIRESLGISLRALAKRTGTSHQAIEQFEKREADQTITIASLKSAAESLGCDFVYAIVPRQPLEEMMHKAAEEAADKILKGAQQTMELEDQSVADAPMMRSRQELIQELENNPRLIWRWVK
jgi:predicted DNA-binding mobile mystery protein A